MIQIFGADAKMSLLEFWLKKGHWLSIQDESLCKKGYTRPIYILRTRFYPFLANWRTDIATFTKGNPLTPGVQ